MPVQPTSAARQRRCSGRGVFNHPRPTPEPPSLDRGYGPWEELLEIVYTSIRKNLHEASPVQNAPSVHGRLLVRLQHEFALSSTVFVNDDGWHEDLRQY